VIIDTSRTLPSAEYLATAIRAAQGAPPPTAPLSKVLQVNQNQIGHAVPLANVTVLLRDDPIFRIGLTVHRDEREWKAMENAETAISTPIRNVIRSILGYGWTLEVGKKRSKGADLLKAFAVQAVERIDLFDVALEQIVKAYYYGWQPMQAVWYEKDGKTLSAFRFNGKKFAGIRQLIEQPGEYFFATPQDQLVFGGDGINLPAVYEGADELAWLRFRSGSTRSPYGRAALAYLWVDWYILKRFRQFYEEGARTALEGVPVFEQKGVGGMSDLMKPGTDRRLETAQLFQDIQACMAYKKTMGALVVPTGYNFREMVKIEASDGWQRALEYLRTQLQIAIEGSTLTSSTGDNGARALGDVHQATKLENCKSVAGAIDPQITRELIHRLIRVNIPSADPEDMPSFVFRIRRRIDPERAKAVSDLGYEVDIAAAAEDWGVPLKTDDQGDPVKMPLPFGAPALPSVPVAQDPQGDTPREGKPPDGSPDATAEPSRGKGSAARPSSPKPSATQQPPVAGGAPPAGGQSDAGVITDLTLNGAQIQAAIEVVTQLRQKTIGPLAALELLVAVGVPRDRAQAIVSETESAPELPAKPPSSSPPGDTAEPPRQRSAARSEVALSRLTSESDGVIATLEDDATGRAASAYQSYIRSLESAVLEVAADDAGPFT